LWSGRIVRWPRRMLPVSHDEYADRTDRRTDGRQSVTLRFPLDAASVMTTVKWRLTDRQQCDDITKHNTAVSDKTNYRNDK